MTLDQDLPFDLRDRAPAAHETVLTNCRIVLPGEVVRGSVTIAGDRITGIDVGTSRTPGAIDCDGAYLLPGLIDVHTDNLEKHTIPRPGVFWDGTAAAVAHDALIVSAGITTVFDSLCLGVLGKPERQIALAGMIDGLKRAAGLGLLRSEHFLHLRCDVSEPRLIEEMTPYIDERMLRFVTILEDSEARDAEHYRFVLKKRGVPDAVLEQNPERNDRHRRWLTATCQRLGIPWGNHDDTKACHVAAGVAQGMRIAEFPLTIEAAQASHEAGLAIVGGAPNLVAGKSHAGHLSMRALMERGWLTVLCSDYIPVSLLQAVFLLTRAPFDFSLPRAMGFVSATPAEAFGLEDRGAIEIGRRADLVLAMPQETTPHVRAVWLAGRRVF